MNKILKRVTIVTSAIVFTACGGGGGGGTSSETNLVGSAAPADAPAITIVQCTDTSDFSTYSIVHSGEEIQKSSPSTRISFSHDSLGNKGVCVLSGSAIILP